MMKNFERRRRFDPRVNWNRFVDRSLVAIAILAAPGSPPPG